MRKKLPETSGVLDERRKPDGRRRIKLTNAERDQMRRQRLMEGAAALFMDLERPRSWPQIAEELGLTLAQLKDLTRDEKFEQIYDDMFAAAQHDPRYKATQAALIDMLPAAAKRLREILLDGTDNASLRAIELLFKQTAIAIAPPDQGSDRKELAEFLVTHQIRLDVPPVYKEALEKYGVQPAVEGEWTELPQLAKGSSED